MSNNPDAQHPASPIRLKQANSQGDFPRSNELAISCQLLIGTIACYFFTKSLSHQIREFANRTWTSTNLSLFDPEKCNELIQSSILELIQYLAPLLGLIFIVGVLSHGLQNTSFAFFNKPILEMSNLNPSNHIQRVFSFQNLLRAVLSLPKTTLFVLVGGVVIWNLRDTIVTLPHQAIGEMLSHLVDCVFAVLIASTATMAATSVLDYVIERFSFGQRNRMTDEQLREENRMQDVDPQILRQRNRFYQELL